MVALIVAVASIIIDVTFHIHSLTGVAVTVLALAITGETIARAIKN